MAALGVLDPTLNVDKRDLLATLSANFDWEKTVPAGSMELVQDDGTTVECALVLMSEWKAKLPAFLK